MKVQRIIAPWKGEKRFTDISKRAAALKKTGKSADEIRLLISEEFGAPAEVVCISEESQPLQVYGIVGYDIDPHAVDQIKLALRLPIAVRGVLMPDAHAGYALPIGGVFEAHRAVSPAMVGVDIGCRMHLSIFDMSPEEMLRKRQPLFADLQASTVFGIGEKRRRTAEHPILDDPRWDMTNQAQDLHAKAAAQLGTSGGGNHFAELVTGTRVGESGLPETFTGLLTHSGSRGVGYAIAKNYMRLAAEETAKHAHVPKMYEWLSLDSEAGQEYWHLMHLAGDYAQANHEVIHATFARRAGLKALHVVQNHHNFAWQHGDSVIHRKGATPAEHGTHGVIPGSMGTASYVVEGLGQAEALWSASHGAGRVGSRSDVKQRLSMAEVKQWLAEHNILVDGLSVDESPQAYKDIERVMELHIEAGLVRILARMQPVAVIMAGAKGRAE